MDLCASRSQPRLIHLCDRLTKVKTVLFFCLSAAYLMLGRNAILVRVWCRNFCPKPANEYKVCQRNPRAQSQSTAKVTGASRHFSSLNIVFHIGKLSVMTRVFCTDEMPTWSSHEDYNTPTGTCHLIFQFSLPYLESTFCAKP